MLARDRLTRPAIIATARRWRVPRAVGLVLLLLSLILLARAFWRDAPALGRLLGGLHLAPALGALCATLAASALVIALWRGLLARLGSRLAPGEATAILSLSYLSRYVPGAIWSFAAIGYLGRRRTIPYRAGAFSLLLAIAMQGLAAILWAAPVVAGSFRADLGRLWPPFVLLAGGALVLAAPATLRLLARPLGLPQQPNTRSWWGHSAIQVAGWLGYWALSGLAALLLLRAIGVSSLTLPTLIGSVALAWLGGLLGSVAPAGLGVQDAALVVILGRITTPEAALAVALLSRVLKTLNDGIYGLVGLLLYNRLGLANLAEAEPDPHTGDPDGHDRGVNHG